MKITQIDIYQLPIPTEPFVIATGTLTTAQNMYVKIYTDEGITGVGECSAFPMIVGETLGTCYAIAQDFAKIWIGKDPLDISARMQELHQYAYRNYTAKSAFDIALYDIAARAAGLPLYQFLGGEKRTIITDMTVGIGEPKEMAEKTVEFIRNGFHTIKVKVGKNGTKDVRRIEAIRNAIGDEYTIRIDANQGWLFEEAEETLLAMETFNIQFCEQPLRTTDDLFLPILVEKTAIPIMADETVYTHYDAQRIINDQGCSSINIKFAKSGGILEALKINQIAAENNIPCMIGGMLESRLAMTAKAHFALSSTNIQFYDLDMALLGHLVDPVQGGAYYEKDHIILSDNLGLDVDIDPDFLRKQTHISIR